MYSDVLIVGAGLSGLIAAQLVQEAGKTVRIIDKGKSVGGRLASRRIANGLADHGAQFFTARTERFQKQVDAWLAQDLIYIWGYGWSDGSLKRTVNDGHARYAAKDGMKHLAKSLAESLDNLHVETVVNGISRSAEGWWLIDEQMNSYNAEVLILTPPVPQALTLLADVPLHPEDQHALERIQYGACLCGLFVLDGEIDLPELGAVQNFEEAIYWIADNQIKGISPNERILTVHVDARYSSEHYEDADEVSLAFMENALKPLLKTGTSIREAQLKKWLYSVPLTTYPKDCLVANGLPLCFAGDAFGGRGRVEGAYLSGCAAGEAALALLNG